METTRPDHALVASFRNYVPAINRNEEQSASGNGNVSHDQIKITPQFTKIDLVGGLPQPGLGPGDMNLLGLHKENVGLKEPINLRDMTSPSNLNVKYGGAKLSTDQVKKVREDMKSKDQGSWRKKPKLINKESYFMEFPMEEVTSKAQLNGVEECALALSMDTGMNIKKKRLFEKDSIHDEGKYKVEGKRFKSITIGERGETEGVLEIEGTECFWDFQYWVQSQHGFWGLA